MKSTKAGTMNGEILVVEDSPTQQEQIRHLLEDHGYNVRTASNGKEALETLRKHQPALVISDIAMPEMDGYALCGEMKSDGSLKDIPVILLTSLSGPDDIIKGLQCGADNFIKKPFDERYLISRVEYILVNRRLRKSDKLQMGVELYLGGQKHFITAERQQILDLLISTYDQAVQLNEELKSREKEIDRANNILRGLYQIAKRLNQATTEQELVEQVLERALELPGFKAGWIVLAEGEADFRIAAACGVSIDLKKAGALDGMCLCRRKLRNGELQRTTIISDCERLLKMDGDAPGQHSHVSIPLLINDRAIGIMNLVVSDQLTFGDDDIQTFNGIGNQIGVALERVRMREHLEQLVQERTAALTAEIAERNRAEEALSQERNLLRALMDKIPDHIYFKDASSHFIRVNKAQADMFGLGDPAQAVGKTDFDFFLGEHARTAYENEQEIMRTGQPLVDIEEKETWPDGHVTWVSTTKVPLRDSTGRITGTFGISRDITERRRAEDALRESQSLYHSFIEQLPNAVFRKDREGRYVLVNPQFCRLQGVKKEDFIGRKPMEIAASEIGTQGVGGQAIKYANVGEDVHEQILQTGKIFEAEEEYPGTDGGILHMYVVRMPVFDSHRTIIGTQGIMFDVSERKQAEQRLEEERNLLRTIIDAFPDEICLKDTERRFILANPGTVRALKKSSEEEIIGKRDEDLIPERFALQAKTEEESVLATGSPSINRVGDSRFNPSTGEIERSILISKIPLKDNSGKVVGLVGINRDITEVQRSKALLEKEHTLLLTLIESIPDEICLKDTSHRFIVANSGIVKAFGAGSNKDLMGKTDFDFMTPDIAQERADEEDAILESGEPVINRERIRRDPVTGQLMKCMLSTQVPVKDHAGSKIGILVINRIITERKRAEDELRSSEERLRILFEYAPDAYYLMNGKGLFVDGNRAAEELSGFAREELIGKSFSVLGLMKQEDTQKASVLLEKNSRGLPSGPDEFTLNRKDGSQVEVEIRTYPVTINNEMQVLGIARDVSQRNKAEEALRASEEKFRALFEESKDAVYFSTVDGRLLDINPAGVELLGYGSKDDLLQIDLNRDGYADAKDKKLFDRQMEADGFVRDFEVALKRKNGKKLTVMETATAVRGKDGKIVQYRGIMRDLTRQRQLEAQFLQAQKMESIGTLAGGIAHDFNNILGIILGHVALLERSRKNEEQFGESVFSVNRAVERGASLVRQILTFARRAETQLEPVNINSAIKELAKMVEETFPKTVEITLKLDKAVPIISMDPTQLHQTLLNLCVNARDAMNGQGTLTVATHLVLGRDVSPRFPKASANHYVQVSVKDTGIGMDEETRQRIFEPFFTTKEKGKGTGLGLAVVYGVLQAHNGFIDVVSAPGTGTTFDLFFPVPEGILITSEKQTGPREDLPRGTETILVVEDEDVLRDLLVKLLEMQGYTVIPASDGEEAVMRFSERANEIDLVLSDMGLPKRSGWDALRMMRKLNSNVRALLASGYIEPGQKSEILESGVVRFIHKPYKMEEVLTAIREILDQRK